MDCIPSGSVRSESLPCPLFGRSWTRVFVGAHVLGHLSRLRLFVTPWTVARQALLSMGFSRQECWSGLPCPALGDLPHPGLKPWSLTSPALAGGLFTPSTTWEAPECVFSQLWHATSSAFSISASHLLLWPSLSAPTRQLANALKGEVEPSSSSLSGFLFSRMLVPWGSLQLLAALDLKKDFFFLVRIF